MLFFFKVQSESKRNITKVSGEINKKMQIYLQVIISSTVNSFEVNKNLFKKKE